MTYYDILGVPTTATKGEIKEAYLKLAKEFHPDKSAGVNPAVKKLVEEKFKDIQEAFDILSKHRAEYDNQLRAVAPPPPPPPPPPPAATKTPAPIPQVPPKAAPKSVGWIIGAVVLAGLWALAQWGDETNKNKAAQSATQATPPVTSAIQQVKNTSEACDPRNDVFIKYGGRALGCPPVTAASTSVLPTKNIKQASFVEQQFGGIVHNQEVNASAEFGIVFQDTGGILSGCMAVKQPLFGSGPLSGQASDTDMSFVVTSAIGKITFVGRRTTDAVSGTYRVEHADRPTELGTFTLAKTKSKVPHVDIQNCPTDAEVHQQTKESIPSQTKLEKDISTTIWKHPGSASPEKDKVWIEKDHLYESSEPWSFPNNENIAHSISCDTVKGATAKLGPSGLYSGECTYTLKWIKEAVTCVVTTTETITTITPTTILGWSQHVDSSPLTHTPATCPIAGVDGGAFALEPSVPMTSAVKEVKETLTQTATVDGYGATIFKRCNFNVGVYPCGILNNSEVAHLVKGDKVKLLSSKIRAAAGTDIYEVKFQQWTGWLAASNLAVVESTSGETIKATATTTVPKAKLYCWLVVTKEHTGMYPTASATDSTNPIPIGTRVYPIKASGGRILIADIHGNNMGVQTVIMKGEWINASNLDCDDKGK